MWIKAIGSNLRVLVGPPLLPVRGKATPRQESFLVLGRNIRASVVSWALARRYNFA